MAVGCIGTPMDIYPKICDKENVIHFEHTLLTLVDQYARVQMMFEDHDRDCNPRNGCTKGKYCFAISHAIALEIVILDEAIRNELGRSHTFIFKCPICNIKTEIPDFDRADLDYFFDGSGLTKEDKVRHILYCQRTPSLEKVDL